MVSIRSYLIRDGVVQVPKDWLSLWGGLLKEYQTFGEKKMATTEVKSLLESDTLVLALNYAERKELWDYYSCGWHGVNPNSRRK